MRITLDLDDDLVRAAQRLTGTTDMSDLLRRALSALVEVESQRRLVALAGTEPDLRPIPRRRNAH